MIRENLKVFETFKINSKICNQDIFFKSSWIYRKRFKIKKVKFLELGKHFVLRGRSYYVIKILHSSTRVGVISKSITYDQKTYDRKKFHNNAVDTTNMSKKRYIELH